VPDGGVFDPGIRNEIGDEHLKYRKVAREVVTFTPSLNARPEPFVHYDVGDWVRARADVEGSTRFDAMFRIWGLTLDVDNNGNESVELKLVNE
jgi:hypothetical protein